MEKVAIISDIHGNLEALKTVLNDIKKRDINKIFCIGDIIAKGTHMHECIELIKNNCEIVIKGNCDEYFTSEIDLSNKPQLEINRILWNKSKITEEDKEYLRSLPYCYEFYMSGRLVRLIHAHPEKISLKIGNIDKVENLYQLFLPSDNTISQSLADIVVYGHIHTQCMHKIYNRVILNTGSVGNSIDIIRNESKDGNVNNTTLANYLIITGNLNSKDYNDSISYEFINIPYNLEQELDNNTDNIEFDSYQEEIRQGKYRDMQKIYKMFDARGIDKDKI